MSAGFEINVEILRDGPPPSELKNGPLVELLKVVKAQITAANSAVKQAKVDQTLIETLLQERMDEDECSQLNGSEGGTAYIKTDEVAQLIDFEAFGNYCSEQNAWHLFQRRINNAAFREEKERIGGDVPGLETFTVKKVATR